MRLSISNIAWTPHEDVAVAALLNRCSLSAIDVAPSKYFPDPLQASRESVQSVRAWWHQRGIEIIGLQALLFGTHGLNLFSSTESQDAMLRYLEAVCRIGAWLGAQWLVFGSPKNRDCQGLDPLEAQRIAIDFFYRLGNIAASYGVVICLEPNPVCYGANFMTTHQETANVVQAVSHSAIKMQLDTGALTLTQEPIDSLASYSTLIGHIHLSEPQLVPLGDGGANHAQLSHVLETHFSDRTATIEMLATDSEPHLHSIERALARALQQYGGSSS